MFVGGWAKARHGLNFFGPAECTMARNLRWDPPEGILSAKQNVWKMQGKRCLKLGLEHVGEGWRR